MSESSSREAIKFLDRNPPTFPEGTLRRFAAEQFGLEGDFKALVSERDQNFRVTGADRQYVLKVANAAESLEVVDLQAKALQHVEKVDPGVPVPRVVRTNGGEANAWIGGPSGEKHIVRLLTFLPGIELGQVPRTTDLLRNLGGAVARLGKALRGFYHPAARHELLWDMQQIPRLRAYTANIADKARRAQVERVLDDFTAEVMPALARLRAQVIHHDANGNNVVVSTEQPDRIAGIVDFGDMVHSALAADPAVTAADLLMGGEILEPLCELVAGYDAVLPLEDDEVDALYDLVLARCALTVVIVAWRNSVPEGLGYLAGHELMAFDAIERLLTLGRAKVRSRLRRACSFPPYCPAPGQANESQAEVEALVARRQKLLGRTLELSYDRPVHVVRGEGPWLICADGSRLLDGYNNVPQVGHAHPHVARAIARQAAALNTNTRYLFEAVLDYSERLLAKMPEGVGVCSFVNSGSEANDVAYRMAKFATGNEGVLVMQNAYHGITDALEALTPYDRHDGPTARHVRTLLSPDPYSGPYRAGQGDLAALYAADADRAIAELAAEGVKPAAFMIDSGFTSNGIPQVPAGYLALVAEKVRAAGGLVIADEVQAGFGRCGSHFWGFQTHGIRPDFVTMGKPIGNGYPLGAVATSRDILERFGKATDFFSTFGGNPVGCAAGIAVLDVIEREGLMENAEETGAYLRDALRGLMDKHGRIGDVRGKGLLVGVELVADRQSRTAIPSETRQAVNRMRDQGVLVGREGPRGNVLKIRPPLAFRKPQADILVDALDKALAAL